MTTPSPQKRPAFEPAARLLQPTGYNPSMPRPSSTTAGVVLVLLRVVAGLVVLIGIAAGWDALLHTADVRIQGFESSPKAAQLALWVVLAVGAVFLAIDALLAILIFRGHNWPRIVVMLVSVVSISSAFAAWWAVGEEITLRGTLLSLSLDILVLLALSSRSASAYARRNERRGG
ncbi:hypothetical protein [Microbacterium deminutum]|uniref:DUF2127 domain-containing protein n=1 Tax=Microbacterium deminutum TaxID=344164 RepID=A0ABP5C2E1_9MICO